MEKFFWGVMRHVENLPERHTEKQSGFVVFVLKRFPQIIWHDVIASKKCENDLMVKILRENMRDMLFLDVFNQANFKHTQKKMVKWV